jgi:sec-independent protein translocase protein TatC
VAVTTPRRAPRDPEGRMPLREHFTELRTRIIRSGLAILLGAVLGWYLYDWLFVALQQPLDDVSERTGIEANINFRNVMDPFNLKVRLSMYLGIVVASPVWLYQVWAFIVPGLTKKEKRYSIGFVAAAVPLFLGGIALAWLVLPNAVSFFAEFAPEGSSLFTNADEYFTFVTRLMLTFAIAMVVPLLLVALNMAGLVSHAALLKGWRVAVFLIFLFAAIASPTPDAATLFFLALPMIALYMAAVGVAWFVDRRRAKQAVKDGFAGLSDDEASPL